MPIFEYIGIDAKGKKTSGTVDADNERAARIRLRKMKIFPTTLGVEGKVKQKLDFNLNIDVSKYLQRIKVQEIAVMTRQLATLVGASIPLVEALSALVDQIENPKLKNILSRVKEKVTEGSKLSDALKGYPKIFDDIFVNMINAGESSGALDVVLLRLSEFKESQSKLRSKVVSAMIYPMIMSIVALALVVMLLIVVVPQITQILKDTGAVLPLPTRFLMGISDALVDYWYLFIIGVPLLIYLVRRYFKTTKGIELWDRKVLTFPLVGRLTKIIIVARFSRTLATLLASGVPLLTAMGMVKNIVTNTRLKAVIEKTTDNVREGESIAEPLKRSGEFPPLVTHMIAIGEKTGDLEKMLERIADTYDAEVDNTLSTLTTLLEPLMILVMAGVVSFIVLSVLLPIMQLNQLG